MDEFDLEKLKQDQEDAQNKKLLVQSLGSVGQSLISAPTAYELLKKTKMDRPDIAGSMNNIAKNIEDPAERQGKLFQSYKNAKEAEQLKRQDDENSMLRDPNSQRSKAYKAFAQKRGMQIDDSTSAYDVMQMMDPKKMNEIESASAIDFEKQMKIHRADKDANAREKALDRRHDMEKISLENALKDQKKSNPSEKLRALSGSDKARYDNALMVAKNIDSMGAALDGGENTFSMVGDNNYTAAERNAAEAYGRMQSGGAINKDEETRFLAMLPRSTDNKEMQRKKLISQRDEMVSRLKTLGFTPEEAGYQAKNFNYGLTDAEKEDQAVAEASQKPSPPDEQAAERNRIGAQLELAKRMKDRDSKKAQR